MKQLTRKTVTIVDYGVGNLQSVRQALQFWGAKTALTHRPDEIAQADYLLLPGVGAFGHGIGRLRQLGLDQAIREFSLTQRPFLGICLGMQLMFERSFEFGEHQGLGLIEGEVTRIEGEGTRVPHIGWSKLCPKNSSRLLQQVDDSAFVYFVHSYQARAKWPGHERAHCRYGGDEILAMVEKDNLFGLQFHPEKSAQAGLNILGNFLQL